jgi:integrase/recombinase XerD
MGGLPVKIVRFDRPHPVPLDLNWARVEEFFKAKSLSPNTEKSYRKSLGAFADWLQRPWPEVTPRMVANYRDWLRDDRNLKPASINLAIAPISSFYGWMGRAYPELELKNPCAAIEPEKVPPPPPKDLLPEEMARLWEVVWQRSLRDQVIFALLAHGLRRGEVCGLLVGDFNGSAVYVKVAKADSVGSVPLSPKAAALVAELCGDRAEDQPIVFSLAHWRYGRSLSPSSVWEIVRDIGDLAGLPRLHPHQLRHTFATRIVLDGIDPQLAMALTRHKSAQVFGRYMQRAKETAAATAFNSLVGEVLPTKKDFD